MGIVFENGIRYFYRQGGEGMNKKKEALKLVERVARVKVEENSFRWPPICNNKAF